MKRSKAVSGLDIESGDVAGTTQRLHCSSDIHLYAFSLWIITFQHSPWSPVLYLPNVNMQVNTITSDDTRRYICPAEIALQAGEAISFLGSWASWLGCDRLKHRKLMGACWLLGFVVGPHREQRSSRLAPGTYPVRGFSTLSTEGALATGRMKGKLCNFRVFSKSPHSLRSSFLLHICFLLLKEPLPVP